ncbi:MAG: ribosome recycling factor [Candidatus Berkelbacteria bacterium]
MVEDLLKEMTPKMEAALQNLREELSRIRTGRANPAILDGLSVMVYGSNMAIKEIASVTVPDASQIFIKPWDKNVIGMIETAIRNSELGLSPINDGVGVRLILPQMTEERRKEIVQMAKKYGDQAKISLRNVRGDVWGKVQNGVKTKEATEDDRDWAEKELNTAITEMNKKVDEIVAEKEREILTI